MGRVSIALSGGRSVLLGRYLGLSRAALIFVCFCLLEFLFDVAEDRIMHDFDGFGSLFNENFLDHLY
jgi:hypothetical protein